MILIIIAALCLLTVPLTGGDLRRLGKLRVRWIWLGPAAVFVQTVLVTIAPGGSHTVHAAAHIGTYVLIATFLWVNRRIAGAPIIALGAFFNALAITVNGGEMPAATLALRIAGLKLGHGFHNSVAMPHPHLLWLGDIIPVPWPLPNVLSVGDIIIYIGMLVLLHRACRVARSEITPGATASRQLPAKPVRPRGVDDAARTRARAVDDAARARARAAAQWLANLDRMGPRTAILPAD